MYIFITGHPQTGEKPPTIWQTLGMEWNGYLEGPDNRTTTSPHNDTGADPEIEEERGGIHIEWGLVRQS